MKILVDGIIYTRQSIGGISRMYDELLPRLCEQDAGLAIDLFVSRPYRHLLPEHARINHVQLFRRDLRPTRFFGRMRPWVDRWIYSTAQRDAIWHSTYHTLPAFPVRATVTTVYDMIYERFSAMYDKPGEEQLRHQIKQSILAADVVLCISQTTANDVIAFCDVPPANIRVIPLAASLSFSRLQSHEVPLPPPTPKPFFLYIGGRLKHKNFRELIAAYSQWQNRASVDFVVIGEPWLPAEKQLLVDLGLFEQVHLQTNVSDHVLRHLYNQALALVYPSLWEGFGMPLLEAVVCGCPIVSSRIPSTTEIAGDYPIYFELGQMDSFHAALDYVFSGKPDLATLHQAASRIVEKYAWEKTARQFLEVYHSFE